MAAKKKRPPRQVWVLTNGGKLCSAVFLRKKEAVEFVAGINKDFMGPPYDYAGPYVLAERVRQR